MKIAIPSYKRSRFIKERTLDYLNKCDIPQSAVYIFVSNADEQKEYGYLEDDGYNVVYKKDLHNLMEKHNTILDYFEQGERIVVMEDDIKKLVRKVGNKIEPYYDFNNLIEKAWEVCDKHNTKLWGINPTNNGFYMTDSIDTKLKVIAGYCFGIEITKDEFLESSIEQKHDYERTLLYYIKYGSVVRVNYIGQESNSFTNLGGVQSQYTNDERCKREIECNEYLMKRFPHLVKKNHRRNKHFNESTELLLSHSVDKKGKLDLYALQKIIDRNVISV